MPISSHDNTKAATATFDRFVIAGPDAPPFPWMQQDIGAVAIPGSTTFANGTFTVMGSGADNWSSADAFQYVYQPLSGDGAVVARVVTEQNVSTWTKTGVMMRNTTAVGSAHVSLYVTPGKGIALQWRASAGGLTQDIQVTGTAPKWVQLARTGNAVSASFSNDGKVWTRIAQVTAALSQTGTGWVADVEPRQHKSREGDPGSCFCDVCRRRERCPLNR